MSDRTDAATRDPSAPEPEPDANPMRSPSPRQRPTATARPVVPTTSPTGSIASSRAISRPTATPDPRPTSTSTPTSTGAPRSSSTPSTIAGGVGDPVGARGQADLPPADRVGDLRLADATGSCASRSPCSRSSITTVDHDERRPPQPVLAGARPRVRQHHADRRRHRRPRLGPGVPARPPAPVVAAERLEHGLVRGHARRTASTWWCRRWRSSPSTPCCRTASRSSWSPCSGLITLPVCCWAFGRLGRFRYPMPELFAFAGLCVRRSTRASASTAATSSRRWRASSRSRSRSRSAMLGLGLLAGRSAHRQVPRVGGGRARRWRAVSHGIVLIFVAVAAVIICLVWIDRTRLVYSVTVGITTVLLSAWWVGPFLLDHAFMTDMKYGVPPAGRRATRSGTCSSRSPRRSTS